MTERLRETLNSPIMDTVIKAVVVMVLPWSIFVTNSIFEAKAFMHRGDRFSAQDGHELERLILLEGQKTRDGINSTRDEIYKMEKEFSSQFVRHSELKVVIEGLKK